MNIELFSALQVLTQVLRRCQDAVVLCPNTTLRAAEIFYGKTQEYFTDGYMLQVFKAKDGTEDFCLGGELYSNITGLILYSPTLTLIWSLSTNDL